MAGDAAPERADVGAGGDTGAAAFAALVAGLPEQAAEAWDAGRAWTSALAPMPPPRRVVCAGMGGSAVGAGIVATLAASRSATPVEVVRDYEPPALDGASLFVACSFSGETEEVLAAWEAAAVAGAARAAITTGGTLARLAARDGAPAFAFRFGGPPRTALGWGVFPLLALLRRAGALALGDGEAAAAIAALADCRDASAPHAPAPDNEARRLAGRLAGGAPVVFGAGALRVAAGRWAAQIAENAGQWAFAEALPEADHNLVAGFARPPEAARLLRAVLLDAPSSHPRHRRRVALTARELERAGVPREVVHVEGAGVLDTALRASYLGDWVSYYLALANGTDPLDVAPIDRVKAALREPAEGD